MLGRNQDETEFGTLETSSLNFLFARQLSLCKTGRNFCSVRKSNECNNSFLLKSEDNKSERRTLLCISSVSYFSAELETAFSTNVPHHKSQDTWLRGQ